MVSIDYYVYEHIDPRDEKLLYIGMGRGDRAWMIGSDASGKRTQRSHEHCSHLLELCSLGYTADQWVNILSKCMSEKSARMTEHMLIKSLSPVFNRRHGPQVKFSDEEVRKIIQLKESGMSDTKISKQIGCSQTTISRIFSGTRSGYKEISEYKQS